MGAGSVQPLVAPWMLLSAWVPFREGMVPFFSESEILAITPMRHTMGGVQNLGCLPWPKVEAPESTPDKKRNIWKTVPRIATA